MSTITLSSVNRTAGDSKLLDDVSLRIEEGELMVVVGPSGSGKTSLIRAVAGLDPIDSGSVIFDDEDMTKVNVAERDIGIVFQTNTLFPTHTARDNVGFPLRIRSMRRNEIKNRVEAEARSLRIETVLERWPKQLSAGHAQLVQLARAMVRVPRVLLLDEPMAYLDMPTRRRLRRELRELQRGYGVTTIYATNDPAEAMYMADRIAALDNGRIRQVGRPDDIYTAPATSHIAWLTGPIGFLDATVESDSDGFWLTGEGFRLRAWAPELEHHESVRVGVRPEAVRLSPESRIRATILADSFEGGAPVSRLQIGSSALTIPLVDLAKGAEVGLAIEGCLVYDRLDRLVAVVG
ncbi:MAG: ABC transporter ATP-binding protein [bacterium]|nr:ABC transporter ATP-binding protein [bacterium]